METLGYLSSILIGLSLGLLGAGGSILTVPVLVYLFRIEPVIAVRYSLFVVGATSLACSLPRLKKREVLLLDAIGFALVSMIVTLLTRSYVVPIIPETIYESARFKLEYSTLSMVLFAVLMVFASKAMIWNRSESCKKDEEYEHPEITFIVSAIGIGLVTGLLGAGGGFLIIPVLINYFKLETKKAIGTSLVIISINAIAGFAVDSDFSTMDWFFITKITALALLGAVVGHFIHTHIQTALLKKSFGWFIFALALIILPLQVYHLFFFKK